MSTLHTVITSSFGQKTTDGLLQDEPRVQTLAIGFFSTTK